MLKVMIVDDEFWICELIRGIINWEEQGFTIVGEAHDGYEALKVIEEKDPDVVLTDIRMAGINGIEFLQRLQKRETMPHVLVISWYSDFEYAQQAMKYGAAGYLLKPIEKNDLLYFLEKIREQRLIQIEEDSSRKDLIRQLSHSRQVLKEESFLKAFQERFKGPLPGMAELNERYSCHFREGVFRVILYQADCKTPDTLPPDQMLPAIKDEIIRGYEASCYENIVVIYGQTILQVINYSFDDRERVTPRLEGSIQTLRERQLVSIRYEMTVGLGEEVFDIRKLAVSFETAFLAVCSRIRLGIGKVISYSSRNMGITDTQEHFLTQERKLAEKHLANSDYESLQLLLQEVFARFEEDQSVSGGAILEFFEDINAMCRIGIERDCMKNEELLEECTAGKAALVNCFTVRRIEEILTRLVRKMMEYQANISNRRNEQIVGIAKRFISVHYREDISLTLVAEKVNLNPRYFSELFKKVTGTGYNDYLTEFRIDMAKTLLKDVRIKAKDVGEMVGYHDAKYFSKLFKKNTGISLAQYRKLFS